MFSKRLHQVTRSGLMELGQHKKWLHLYPEDENDFSAVTSGRQVFFHSSFSKVQSFVNKGFEGGAKLSGVFDCAVVHLPRSKALAKHLIFLGTKFAPEGIVYVDGAKTQGVESILKAVSSFVPIAGQVSGSHGRLFWFLAQNVFSSWKASCYKKIEGGFLTRAGVFSADHIDPASAFLADAMPNELLGAVADLGAGWGYLSHRMLRNPGLSSIDLVEVDNVALSCAKLNCDDERAVFYWRDIETWTTTRKYDHVVMNPPFHIGRKVEPDLGKTFIQKAYSILKKTGILWMVSNRHLSYEAMLSQLFTDFDEVAGDNRFKVLKASGTKG